MKSKLLLLLILILSFSSITYPEEADELLIDCDYYWNNHSLILAPDAKPIQYYIDSAILYSKNYKRLIRGVELLKQNFEDKIQIHVDSIGIISNRLIVDIIFKGKLGTTFYDVGKMTLIEINPSKFRLLYSFFSDPGCVKFNKSIIVKVDSFRSEEHTSELQSH